MAYKINEEQVVMRNAAAKTTVPRIEVSDSAVKRKATGRRRALKKSDLYSSSLGLVENRYSDPPARCGDPCRVESASCAAQRALRRYSVGGTIRDWRRRGRAARAFPAPARANAETRTGYLLEQNKMSPSHPARSWRRRTAPCRTQTSPTTLARMRWLRRRTLKNHSHGRILSQHQSPAHRIPRSCPKTIR